MLGVGESLRHAKQEKNVGFVCDTCNKMCEDFPINQRFSVGKIFKPHKTCLQRLGIGKTIKLQKTCLFSVCVW